MILQAFRNYLKGIAKSGDSKFDVLSKASMEYMQLQNDRLHADFEIGSFERWDIDQENGELCFSTGGVVGLIARFQFVGSYSMTSRTWLWGWANSSILPSLTVEMEKVRSYGAEHHFQKLTRDKWNATEDDGWMMAAISNYLLKAQGVYRPPFDQGVAFVVVTQVQSLKK